MKGPGAVVLSGPGSRVLRTYVLFMIIHLRRGEEPGGQVQVSLARNMRNSDPHFQTGNNSPPKFRKTDFTNRKNIAIIRIPAADRFLCASKRQDRKEVPSGAFVAIRDFWFFSFGEPWNSGIRPAEWP
jgi:hypothetical protein